MPRRADDPHRRRHLSTRQARGRRRGRAPPRRREPGDRRGDHADDPRPPAHRPRLLPGHAQQTGRDDAWIVQAQAMCADPVPGMHTVLNASTLSSSSLQETEAAARAASGCSAPARGWCSPQPPRSACRSSARTRRHAGLRPGARGRERLRRELERARLRDLRAEPAGYAVVSTPSPDTDSLFDKYATASCPAGTQVTGAGGGPASTAPGGVVFSYAATSPTASRKASANGFESSEHERLLGPHRRRSCAARPMLRQSTPRRRGNCARGGPARPRRKRERRGRRHGRGRPHRRHAHRHRRVLGRRARRRRRRRDHELSRRQPRREHRDDPGPPALRPGPLHRQRPGPRGRELDDRGAGRLRRPGDRAAHGARRHDAVLGERPDGRSALQERRARARHRRLRGPAHGPAGGDPGDRPGRVRVSSATRRRTRTPTATPASGTCSPTPSARPSRPATRWSPTTRPRSTRSRSRRRAPTARTTACRCSDAGGGTAFDAPGAAALNRLQVNADRRSSDATAVELDPTDDWWRAAGESICG